MHLIIEGCIENVIVSFEIQEILDKIFKLSSKF